jgi:uncharacterized membrane protein YcjF (UPF0283 family)
VTSEMLNVSAEAHRRYLDVEPNGHIGALDAALTAVVLLQEERKRRSRIWRAVDKLALIALGSALARGADEWIRNPWSGAVFSLALVMNVLTWVFVRRLIGSVCHDQ